MNFHSRLVGVLDALCLGLAASVMIALMYAFAAPAPESVGEHPQPVARMVAVDEEVRI